MISDKPLHRMINVLDRGRRLDFALIFSENISVPEYVILLISAHMKNTKGTVYVSDIVKEFGGSAPAISKHLRSCEEKGYIERFTDKDDRRNTLITVTELGGTVLKKTMSELTRFSNRLLKKIPSEEFMDWIDKTEHFRVVISNTIEELRVK